MAGGDSKPPTACSEFGDNPEHNAGRGPYDFEAIYKHTKPHQQQLFILLLRQCARRPDCLTNR